MVNKYLFINIIAFWYMEGVWNICFGGRGLKLIILKYKFSLLITNETLQFCINCCLSVESEANNFEWDPHGSQHEPDRPPSCPIYSVHFVLMMWYTPAGSGQCFEHVPGLQLNQVLFRILLFRIYVREGCCHFQCLWRKEQSQWIYCKTFFMIFSGQVLNS